MPSPLEATKQPLKALVFSNRLVDNHKTGGTHAGQYKLSASPLFFTSPFQTDFANGMADSRESSENADMEVCATYLKALGDPVRLQVVRALRTGPLSVSDVAILLDIELANVSHHLRVLYHAKIVTTAREGKFIYYALNDDFLTGRSAKKSLDFGCCQVDLKT